MIHAFYRKALADLRSRKLQTVLIMLILVLATAVLTLAVALLRSTSSDNPWDRVFAGSNGAHIWFASTDADVDLSSIGRLDGVTETTGPLPYVWGHYLVQNHDKYELGLYGMPPEPPSVGHPLVTDGHWLTADGENEIVIDQGMAGSLKIAVGDPVDILIATGKVTLKVVGLAVNPGQGPYPYCQPGLGYVLPATLARLEPDKQYWQWKLGVRLADPEAIPEFLKRVDVGFPQGAIADTSDWRQVRYLWVQNASNPAFNQSMVFFGLFALVAVGFVIANVIGGIVLSQYREIGLLKAVGMTPGQVALLFLLEYLGLSLVAGVVGLGLGVAIAPFFLRTAAKLLNVPPIPAFDPLSFLFILLGVETAVALFTLLPARQGGRISTVQAITTGFAQAHHKPSRLARLSAWLRLPPFLTLGLKDTFARPLRAWLTIGAVALTVVIMVITLMGIGEIRNMISLATSYDMIIQRAFLSDTDTRKILDERPEVSAYYSEVRVSAKAVGQATTFQALVLGGAYSQFVHISEGRLFTNRNEAIAMQGLLDLLGLKIGDELHLTVNGRPLDLRIVGRYFDVGSDSRMAMFSLETLKQAESEAQPVNYYLKLAPGMDPKTLEDKLISLSNDQFKIGIIDQDELLSQGGDTWTTLYGMYIVMLAIGVVSLLITTLLGVRERRRDFGILKTIGLTPNQIVASVIAGVSPLALLAVTIAIPLGVWLTRVMSDYFGRVGGYGTDIMTLPAWWWFALLYPIALLLAALGSFIPARQAAQVSVVEVLRYE